MELRYLRYFVAVAEARHFTKAAKELGISQPPLSQQIQRLEREIGTPLFRRLTRGVELTEAGESFYEDACQILALSDAALEKTKGIARGLNGRLSLGITSSDAFHPQIFSLLQQFQQSYPGVTLHQVEGNMATLMGALGEAELDIAFVRLPCESSKAFNLRIIDQEPMVIALARSHPLSSHRELTLEQDRLMQRPARELQQLRQQRSRYQQRAASLPTLPVERAELVIGSRGSWSACFGEALTLICNEDGLTLSRRNLRSGETEHRYWTGAVSHLQILCDRSSIEIFINDGEGVMSARYFPNAVPEVVWQGEASLTVDYWQLRSGMVV